MQMCIFLIGKMSSFRGDFSDVSAKTATVRVAGSKSLTPIAKSVRNAENILKKQNSNIIAAFASDKKADGLLALAALDQALLEFDTVIENKDKQEVCASIFFLLILCSKSNKMLFEILESCTKFL